MSEFFLLLLCAAGAAYAAGVAVHLRTTAWLLAVLFAAFAGVQTVLLVVLTGDGRILPGLQFSPNLKALWGDALASTPLPHPYFCLAVLAGHLLLFFGRPGRRSFWLPMPASVAFFLLFLALNARTKLPPTLHERELGPARIAYLTMMPLDDGGRTRLVIADGKAAAAFLDVRIVHETGSLPPMPRLFWTRDGKGLVFMALRQRIWAMDVESGEIAGGLPEQGNEWPRHEPAAESVATQRKLSQWRKDVADFVEKHGGIYVR